MHDVSPRQIDNALCAFAHAAQYTSVYKHCLSVSRLQRPHRHSRAILEKPRFRFFMAAKEPAIVSLIFSPAAAALDRAAAVLPPNLRSTISNTFEGRSEAE